MLGGQLMGVARFPGTAANPFRIDSKARPARLRDGPLSKSYGTIRAVYCSATPSQGLVQGLLSVSFGTENTTMAPTTAKAANM